MLDERMRTRLHEAQAREKQQRHLHATQRREQKRQATERAASELAAAGARNRREVRMMRDQTKLKEELGAATVATD